MVAAVARMKLVILFTWVALGCQRPVDTSVRSITMNIWPDRAPGNLTQQPEQSIMGDDQVLRLEHVSQPALAVHPAPAGEASSPTPAVLVLPGGGFKRLAYNKEGTEIAEWLNALGITAVVLKYRIPDDPDGAFMDTQRAMGLIRQNANDWSIDPNQVGVIGFSAGGRLAGRLSTSYRQRTYDPIDAADDLSCRPDFTMLVYPAWLSDEEGKLLSDVPIDRETPPAILVQTQDDFLTVNPALAYYRALVAHEVPAELHLYPTGGHGYGLRPGPHLVSEDWPKRFAAWLERHALKGEAE